MSLPTSWVDRIFEKLALVYGRDFTERYSGLSPAAVKAEWGRELALCARRPECIAYALDNLPVGAKPPTSIEFRALCAKAPVYDVPKLAAPRADDAKVSEVLAAAKGAVGHAVMAHNGWEQRLEAKALAGEIKLTQAQREAIRAAKARSQREGGEE
jgi:hypothetical protein